VPVPNEVKKGSALRTLGAVIIVFATACVVIAMLLVGVTEKYAANRDFVEYWAAGQQLFHHQNPYDTAAILRIERAAGMDESAPQISLSPPFALCLLLPLGLVSAKNGFVIWMIVLMASLLVSIWGIWSLNGRPDSGFHLAGLIFAPATACFLLGQIGVFLLLGLVLFLCWHDRWPYAAGAVLLPCVWKPHLFLPFFIVLALWSFSRKEFRIIASFLAVVGASYVLTLRFDPGVWSHYRELMTSQASTLHGYVPTLSVTLRFLIAPSAVWLQFIPEIAACAWSIWYFWTRRQRWRWMDQGSWVLLLSAVCTPYAWFTDEAILLPALLFAVYRATDAGRSLLPIAAFAFAALIEVCAFGHIASTHYLWTVPAWVGWYLYATWRTDGTMSGINESHQYTRAMT
jgi:Glycosyltransferase family 87